MSKIFFIGKKEDGESLKETFAKTRATLVPGDRKRFLSSGRRSERFQLVLWDLDGEKGKPGPEAVSRVVAKMRERCGKIVLLSSRRNFPMIRETHQAGAGDFITKPFNQRELITRIFALLENKKRVCCVGGGTGLFTLLSALKTLPNVLLISLVNMSDDGGSSGRLRSSFGILPPGDIRRSLVALSNAPEMMNELVRYRFERGGELRDHSMGNLLLTALTEIKGSMGEAVRALGDILNVQGVVLPITNTLTEFVARFENGKVIHGESKISTAEGRHPALRIQKVWHEPAAECDASAYASMLHADIITIGPGDLFSSVITNLVIGKVREAFSLTRAKKIYVCNLMTRPGETSGLDAREHVKRIVDVLAKDLLDLVLVSQTRFSASAIARYAKLDQHPVAVNQKEDFADITKARIALADVADQHELVRHDPAKLRRELSRIIARA